MIFPIWQPYMVTLHGNPITYGNPIWFSYGNENPPVVSKLLARLGRSLRSRVSPIPAGSVGRLFGGPLVGRKSRRGVRRCAT